MSLSIPISILSLYCFQMLVITLLECLGWFDGIIRSVLRSYNLRSSYSQTILSGISSLTTMSTIHIWNIPPFYPSSLDHILTGDVSLCIIFTLYDRPKLFKYKIMVSRRVDVSLLDTREIIISYSVFHIVIFHIFTLYERRLPLYHFPFVWSLSYNLCVCY